MTDPADLFTTCLTTPIKMALRWFISTHSLIAKSGGITEESKSALPQASGPATFVKIYWA